MRSSKARCVVSCRHSEPPSVGGGTGVGRLLIIATKFCWTRRGRGGGGCKGLDWRSGAAGRTVRWNGIMRWLLSGWFCCRREGFVFLVVVAGFIRACVYPPCQCWGWGQSDALAFQGGQPLASKRHQNSRPPMKRFQLYACRHVP